MGVNIKGRRHIEEDIEVAGRGSVTRWPREMVSGQERVHTSTRKPEHNPCRAERGGLSRIGLAKSLVQFNKRPLYSLKAAYTNTYEKNLWYKELQNTNNR